MTAASHEEDEPAEVTSDVSQDGDEAEAATVVVGHVTSVPELLGRRLGAYTLIEELGRGGQGTVFLARDERLSRQVALKILPPSAGLPASARARFEREAEVASRLDHPGICTVYEVGEAQGLPFIAMQYVDGEPLDRRIKAARSRTGDGAPGHVDLAADDAESAEASSRSAPRSEGDGLRPVIRFIEEAARALHAAHEAGLVHRDIKPSNIMLARDGRAVVLDFGLAREEDGAGETLTRTGDLVGTPAYMSPEQLREDAATIDRRTDVHALGVTLYECVTLRRPFQGATREALCQAILHAEPEDPRAVNPGVSRDLAVVIEVALEKDRARRYATALDLAEDLRRVRRLEPILARPAGWALKLRRWAQRNPALATAVVAVFFLLVAGLLLSVFWIGRLAAKNREVARESRLKEAALADFTRMADVPRLAAARRKAAGLWPAHPELVPALERWLADYRGLIDRLPRHRAALEELRRAALPYDAASRARDHEKSEAAIERLESEREATLRRAEATTGEEAADRLEDEVDRLDDRIAELRATADRRASWEFGDDGLATFKHGVLAALVDDLASFADPKKGLYASVESRLARARRIGAETIDAHAGRWAAAIAAIAAGPLYGGLKITPQVGLVPLGADPASGLHEFLHFDTHARGAPIPERAGGRLRPAPETGLVLVLLPAGRFRLGAQRRDPSRPNHDPSATQLESPVEELALDAFFLSKYEMTQAQWERFMGWNPSRYRPGAIVGGRTITASNPLEQIDWPTAERAVFAMGLTLPTEAQWEYACRAGSSTVFTSGDEPADLAGRANIADEPSARLFGKGWVYERGFTDGHAVHAPAGSFSPNAFGLHDMHGNVWEWCRDGDAVYGKTPIEDGTGARTMTAPRLRIARGGSFGFSALHARSAMRMQNDPGLASSDLGLRPARRLE